MKKIKVLISLFCIFFATEAYVSAQVDMPRRTTAITYPLDELVVTQFRGTTRFPRMKGEAKVKRTSRNGSEIDLSVSKMPRPFELGAGYATYVLWAISPDGQVDNLGEIKRRGYFEFDSKISVTTKLQTFALIITAEPHFLVRRPSQEIMLENLSPYTASGKTIATTPSIQYFGNSSDYFRDARTPEIAEVDYSKTPSTILQARQAVALARFAGADRDAIEELQVAANHLTSAETSWRAGRAEEDVDISARQAVSAAVKAESTAFNRKEAREKRNEKTRADAEIRTAENRYQDALDQIASLQSELAREIRNRELVERDGMNQNQQIKDLRAENGRLREELGRTKLEADNAKAKLESIENQQRIADESKAKIEREREAEAARETFIQSLRGLGSITRNGSDIILTMPENLWVSSRSSDFSPSGITRIESLAQLLMEQNLYRLSVESHTDNRGVAEELEAFTAQRSQAIAAKLVNSGVEESRIQTRGLGSGTPIAANNTVANRAKNRRTQVILTPSF